MNSRDVFIVSAVRTPIGKFGKSLSLLTAPELGGIVIREAVNRAGINPADIDEVIMGNVLCAGVGQHPAKYAAYLAGLPETINGFSVNKVCAFGLRAVVSAAQTIKAGDNDIVIAGGMESMSNAPVLLPPSLRWGFKLWYAKGPYLIDEMVYDGLKDAIYGHSMGEIADIQAKKHGISRRELDEYALMSHQRAHVATKKGWFKDEMIIVDIKKGDKRVYLDKDEGIRPDTSLEKLLSLKPAFTLDGVTTAGNSSQISDGASALVLMSGKKVRELKIEPLAKILDYSWVSLERGNFIEAPIYATKKLLKKMSVDIDYFDLIEVNEAFAVVNVLYSRVLKVEYDKMNVHGGAIALGHPIGASGARILTTLIYALKRMGLKRGLAAICHGGGGALALSIELV